MRWTNNVVYKIVLTSLFLALAIIIDFTGKFMPFNSFLKFNFSLIFVLATFRIVGKLWGILVLVLIFVIGPSYSELGYSAIGVLGHGLLVVAQATFIAFYLLFHWCSLNFIIKKSYSPKLRENLANITAFIFASICATLVMVAVNIFISTPLYFYLFKAISSPNFLELSSQYNEKFKALFFGIPNYYVGTFVVFGTFNIANYTINSVLLFTILGFAFVGGFLHNNQKNIKLQSEQNIQK
ncbi:hypothetical protein E1I18_02545 [Mycoplasmopsis mucosicanis]|uniref:ECF transporter S component n=1 Tax=Mycoplasmopsis mucosicanis TaxID=458208 RepID=A0A507SHW4_9BACT|nr:hypothetical protein [Mycoplasmopsis mucosicanis]TQC51439.1 hypothetical protein E1I18_02545 [Mycoplasmopsis mucosicanis]